MTNMVIRQVHSPGLKSGLDPVGGRSSLGCLPFMQRPASSTFPPTGRRFEFGLVVCFLSACNRDFIIPGRIRWNESYVCA